MPATEEMIEKAQEALEKVQLVQFSADRTQLRLGDGGTSLNWEVAIPGSRIEMLLNGLKVQPKASRQINPVRDITYDLSARILGIQRPLGTVRIQVTQAECKQMPVAEGLIVGPVQNAVDERLKELNADPDSGITLRTRRKADVQIEPSGLNIRLRLVAEINNFANADIDIDAKIVLGITADSWAWGYYRSFSVDIDWPWWVTGSTLGASKIYEQFIQQKAEPSLKQDMLDAFKNALNEKIREFKSTGALSALECIQDGVIVTICT